jgi:hypothetical protein
MGYAKRGLRPKSLGTGPKILRNVLYNGLKVKKKKKKKNKQVEDEGNLILFFGYKGQISSEGHYGHLKGSDYIEPVKVRQRGL